MDYVNSLKERFHRKYVATTPGKCWEWKGYVSKLGYGQLRNVPGERPVVLMAHRLSWELHTKLEIPEELCVPQVRQQKVREPEASFSWNAQR
jgi:hypothetical protein